VWIKTRIARYLRTGNNCFGYVAGGVQAVVGESTRRMSIADLSAAATDLEGLPAAAELKRFSAVIHATACSQGTVAQRCTVDQPERAAASSGAYPGVARNRFVVARDPITVRRVMLQAHKLPRSRRIFVTPGAARPRPSWSRRQPRAQSKKRMQLTATRNARAGGQGSA
jgi:hypothetical protein